MCCIFLIFCSWKNSSPSDFHQHGMHCMSGSCSRQLIFVICCLMVVCHMCACIFLIFCSCKNSSSIEFHHGLPFIGIPPTWHSWHEWKLLLSAYFCNLLRDGCVPYARLYFCTSERRCEDLSVHVFWCDLLFAYGFSCCVTLAYEFM